MLRTLLIAVLIYSTTLTAIAQQTDPAPATPKIIVASTISDWSQSRWSLPHEVIVITLARPGARQKCEFPDLDEDTLTCAAQHNRPPTTYKRADVAALIHPRSHQERNIMLIPVALMVVSLAGSFFVPLAWSITLRIFTFLFFCAFGAMGTGATGSDHGDTLLYQRPNTPLTVKLRTH